MAAFGFFRRRQKMVLWIMVILMVAFLIPTGLRGLSESNPAKEVIGSAGETEITVGARREASTSLELYRRLGLTQGNYAIVPLQVFLMEAERSRRGDSDPSLHWALLVQEARSMGMAPTKAQLNQFLASRELSGGHLREAASRMGKDFTESQARNELADLVAVLQAFGSSAVNTWPSLPELRHIYVEIREKIQVATASVPAKNFLAQVGEPTKDDIDAWFKLYRNLLPDDPTNRTEFGFGYSLPDRVKVQYVLINTQAVQEAIEPSPEQMRDYWQRYKGQITIKVPASAPATAPADGDKAPEFVDVPAEKFSQAMEVIRQTLRTQMAESKITELVARVRELSDRFSKEPDPYAKVVEAMILPADSLLATKVEGIEAGGMTLSQAIDRLSNVTKVQIVYPFGKHGDMTLDGQLKVAANAKWNGKTLGAVLAEIAQAHKFPPMHWVTCDGLGNSIFASAPVNMAPLRAGDSGLVALSKIAEDPLLAKASTNKEAAAARSGEGLVEIVASAFGPEGEQTRAIQPGEEFRQTMYVGGSDEGRLLWRLAVLARAESPAELTGDLRAQVVRDWKIQQAFNKAYAAAQEIAKEVEKGANLETLAKAQGLTYEKLNLLSRTDPEARVMAPAFVQRAFSLFPADPDRPDPRPAVTVAPLYRQQKAAVLERLAFEPAVKSELSNELLMALGTQIIRQRGQMAMFNWFNGDEIVKRMHYTPKAR